MTIGQHEELEPDETDIVGQWLNTGGRIDGDSGCRRIEWLVSERLKRLGADASGWDVLYRDPRDGRLWELTYPNSAMHGGGPPRLTVISPDAAARKYDAGGLTGGLS
jgi:hypothetical protein